jgi:hypothetical protein
MFGGGEAPGRPIEALEVEEAKPLDPLLRAQPLEAAASARRMLPR